MLILGITHRSAFFLVNRFEKCYANFFQDKEKEENLPLTEVSVDDILDAQRREQDAKIEQQKLLSKALKERGLNLLADLGHDDMF